MGLHNVQQDLSVHRLALKGESVPKACHPMQQVSFIVSVDPDLESIVEPCRP